MCTVPSRRAEMCLYGSVDVLLPSGCFVAEEPRRETRSLSVVPRRRYRSCTSLRYARVDSPHATIKDCAILRTSVSTVSPV